MTPRPRAGCCIPTAGNQSYRPILSLFIFLSVLLGLVATTTAWADDDDDRIDIDNARWSNDRDRLRVDGDKAPDNATVTIRYGEKEDNGAVIGTTQSDGDGDWEFRITDLNPVPCDVTAQAAGVDDDDKEVRRAPNNCSNVGGGGGQNVPPTANAGPDQTVTLASGQTTIAVTLNGSASSDPDGTIATYNWTGNPNPANEVSPTVNLAEGSHTFTLVVTDNNGASSAADTVVITVNPAAPGNQAPTANAGSDQTVTLASGQTTFDVTLDGSGSSDPDGTIASYTWTGNPNPDDVVNPTVTLGEGSHTFTLVVTDNDGASSSPDTVVITVNPAVPGNQAPTADAGPDQTVTLASGQTTFDVTLDGSGSSDPDGTIASYTWTGNPNPDDVVNPTVTLVEGSHTFTLVVTDNDGTSSAPDTVVITVNNNVVACNPADLNVSINSTSQNGCPDATLSPVTSVSNNNYSVLAINDLGMHCGDLDTRIASILPPFQAMLVQVIDVNEPIVQGGVNNKLNPPGVDLFYSAVSNPADPLLDPNNPRNRINVFDGRMDNGGATYKTNFWNTVAAGTYDPFYPAFNPFTGDSLTPLAGPPFNVGPDVGLPVPNVEHFFLGTDGVPNTGDESLSAVLHAMPGIAGPYTANDRQQVKEHYTDKPFFMNFPFGYVAEGVNWYEGAGIPFSAFDDNGRENAYPLVRVEARQGNTTVSTVDTVLPISGEADCTNCHADPDDLLAIRGTTSRSTAPTDALVNAGLDVALSLDDPDNNLPARVSLEYAGDINTLRLHDLKHGTNYVTPAAANDGTAVSAPCVITANLPADSNGDANCLTNKALVQNQPVVCQVCHYTPALDLAQLGPLTGPVVDANGNGTIANGRNHLHHKSNSFAMHSHHGSLENGTLFTEIPAYTGTPQNLIDRSTALEESCYQCHPGNNTQCLRGAMFNAEMLCNDCHGNMQQVGNDFTANVTVTNPGPDAWIFGGNYYDPADPQPRVPWANEPGCGSCHTGDFNTNIAGDNGTLVNAADVNGNPDGIRLRQAYLTGDAKATPIVPVDPLFAEPEVPATTANGVPNNGAGNPQLYRVSTGHGGVMCEGCHGATHAEWPNANPNSNDNVTANQLQGHTGVIIECSTCHGDALNNSNTLNGPHGMHPVGNDETVLPNDAQAGEAGPRISFVDGGHSNISTNGCDDCHGGGGRGNNQGTVLSVAKKDRFLDNGIIPAGTPIGCSICH